MGIEAVLYNLEIFLTTEFEGGRHQRRVELYDKIISLSTSPEKKAAAEANKKQVLEMAYGE
jgi:hypothetical protein